MIPPGGLFKGTFNGLGRPKHMPAVSLSLSLSLKLSRYQTFFCVYQYYKFFTGSRKVDLRLPGKGEFKFLWREAVPPNHQDDKVDSDQ